LKEISSLIEELKIRSLESILDEAWDIRRKNFPPVLNVSAPSAKTYISDHFRNTKNRFVNITVTGNWCELNCEHCKKKLLESMVPALTPEKLREVGDSLIEKDCQGVLISGGASSEGTVPLDKFMDSIAYLKERGLQVIVHTGLLNEKTAQNLKAAGVDQVLIDVMGDTETIKEVYHLDKTPADFEESLRIMKTAQLRMAPHIVIGLNHGKIRGEYNALRFISEVTPDVIVLVVLSPMHGTPMHGTATPAPEEVARIAAIARIVNENTPVSFGCARPSGSGRVDLERMLIRAGVNSIAYPSDEAVDYATDIGLRTIFVEKCCTLS
jgi:uncharacterized radical SAM superfamily protein